MDKQKKPEKERYDKLIDKKKDFPQWFKQVFIYHYKWYIIIGAVVLFAFGFLFYDSITKKENDMDYVTAAVIEMTAEPVQEMRRLVETTIGDLNGDGAVIVNNDVCQLGEATSVEASQAFYYKLLASFNMDKYVMYILDKKALELYSKEESPFDPLPIKLYSGKDALAISLDETQLMQDTGYVGEKGLYIAFRGMPQSNKLPPEEYYAVYFKILDALFGKAS